jgi:hypothetical protein
MSERIVCETESAVERSDRNLAAWSMLAGLLLFGALAVPFFAGRVYTADDLGAFHLPTRAFYAECLANGDACDWMPQLYSGFYLTGEGQAGVYHPLHQVLYRFLPLRAALAWECLISYPLMMLGTWLWLRRRIGRGDAAMLGGLLFAFSSFNLLHFVHPNAVAVIAHIPWLLWAIDIVLVDSRRLKVAMATASIALLTGSQLLLGYPQYVWFSLLAEASYVLFVATTRKYSARSCCNLQLTCDDCAGCTGHVWPRLLIAKAIGLLLGGVQLLPSIDALSHSSRASADATFLLWGSLYPGNLLQLVAPYVFVDRVIGGNTHEFGLYAGAAPLLLCVWALARRRDLGSLAPLAWAALAFAAVALWMALGQYGGLYGIAAWLPLIRSFRCPCRYIVLFQLAMAVLAAIGFVRLIGDCRQARRQTRRLCDSGKPPVERRRRSASLWRDFEPLWCVVAASAVVAVTCVSSGREIYTTSIAAALAGPALLAAAAALIALAARGRSAALVGLILLAAVDLGWYGASYAVYRKNDMLEAYAASARTPPGNADGRVVACLLRFDESGLRCGNQMTLTGWQRADGYAGLEPARTLDYHQLPALRVAGVRWVARNPSTVGIVGLDPYDDYWMEVPHPLPRARLVAQTQTSLDPARDITQISPDATALTEVPLALPISTPGKAVLTVERAGRFEVGVECPAPQLLVLAESYHRGWQATVDGDSQAVYRLNGDFMGCVVGPGKHQVIFSFHPDSLRRGWYASCAGLCLVSLCFFGCTARPNPNPLKDELT